MTMTIGSMILRDVMRRMAAVAARGRTMPVLANVKIDTDGSFTAFDGETALVAAPTCNGGVKALANARAMLDIAGSLPDEDVAIHGSEGKVCIACGRASFTLAGQNPDDYPALPTPGGASSSVSGATLARAISIVEHAAMTDDARPPLNGILFSGGKAIATDGHRLAIADSAPGEFTLSRSSATEIRKLADGADAVRLVVGKSTVHASTDEGWATVIARQLEGQFPDVAQIMPRDTNETEVPVSMLRDALQRVGIVADQYKTVEIEFQGNRILLSTSTENGEAHESVVCRGAANCKLGINYRYLLDALAGTTTDTVLIGIIDDKSPVVVRGDGYIEIVMPVRL